MGNEQFAMTRKEVILILLFFIFLSGLLFRQWVFGGRVPVAADLQVNFYEPWRSETEAFPYKPLGFDDIRIFYPQRIFATNELKAGRLPLWNPYEFSGNVHLANSQTATFYPPFLLYLILPSLFVWSLMAFILPVLAGIFTYLFLRLGVGKHAALLGATAFVLSGAFVVRLEDGQVPGHNIVWLPLALYGVEKFCQEGRHRFLFWTFLALSFSILAGWFQFSFYVLAVTAVYALFRRMPIARIVLIFALVAGATFVHWFPAAQAFGYSPRAEAVSLDLKKHLMGIEHLLTYISPNLFGHPVDNTYFGRSEYKEGVLYVGLVPLLLAIIGIWKNWKDERVRFFTLLALLALPFGFNLPLMAEFLQRIPLVSAFLPNRIFVIAGFSLSVLAAFGAEGIWRNWNVSLRWLKRAALAVAGVLGTVLLAIGAIYVNEKILLPLTRYSFFEKGLERYLLIALAGVRESFILFLPVALLLFFARRLGRRVFWAGLLAAIVFSGLVFSDRYLYFSSPSNLFPEHPVISFLQGNTRDTYFRYVTVGSGRFTSNTATYYGLYDVEGVDALYPSWYGEFMGYVKSEGKSLAPQDRISTWFAPRLTSVVDWQSPYVLNFLRLTGVKYVVTKNLLAAPPTTLFAPAFVYKDWVVYEYKNALPKAIFVDSYQVVGNKEEMLARMFDSNFDPAKEVFLFSDPGFVVDFKAIGEAHLVSYGTYEIQIDVSASGPGMVFVNDNYFPRWKVTVDGVAVPLLRANYTFRAVPVPAGRHEIKMAYNYF